MTNPEIIFEDNDVLVINKPIGLLVHGEGADPKGTVVEWFLRHSPEAKGVGEPRINNDGEELERSGIVHRLDKETSGVMILAKNQDAFTFLKDQFQNRLAKKEYWALVYGAMKERWGTINRPIGRSAKDWRRRSAERGAKGQKRDAVTDWECLLTGLYEGEKFSILKLLPKTGRMHQLRVHLKAVDHPIVGDGYYAGSRLEQSNNLGLERLALHAHKLQINLPNGEEKEFVAQIPENLEKAAERIAK